MKGRKKNVIVLESGKNVYPEEVEWEIARIPYVEEVLVRRGIRQPHGIDPQDISRGQGQEVVEAVIYPNQEWVKKDGHRTDLQTIIWEAVKERQGRLAPHKRIRRKEDIILVDRPFPKTSTMDIKRHLYKGGNNVSDA